MSATLKSAIPAGGILAQHAAQDFEDYVVGRSVKQRIVIAVLEAQGVTADTQQTSGRVNKTKYGAVHLVEIRDPHEADQLRHRITQLRADQGFAMKQPALFDMTEAEQVESLKDLIKDWASTEDTPIADVDARWVEYFGGPENSASLTVQASRSVTQLKEFALVVGAITDGPTEPEEEIGDEDEGGEASDETAGAPSVPFQDGPS